MIRKSPIDALLYKKVIRLFVTFFYFVYESHNTILTQFQTIKTNISFIVRAIRNQE